MANYAVLENNIVTNVVVADSVEDAVQATGLTCVEYTEESPAGIGWTYDGTSFTDPSLRIEPKVSP
jgi:hypothetical protein